MISYKNHPLAAISSGNKNRLRKSALSERLNLKEEFIERKISAVKKHGFQKIMQKQGVDALITSLDVKNNDFFDALQPKK